MKKYKMILCDFDGTLAYGEDNYVSETNLHSINAFIHDGGIFIVCTGRATPGILPILNRVNYKGVFASYNGAVITDLKTGEVIYRKPISNEICLKFLKFIKTLGVNTQIYPNDKITIEKYTEYTKWYLTFNKLDANVVPSLYDFVKESGCDTPKILLIDDKEVLDKNFNAIYEFLTECNVIRATDNMVEITLKGVTKGSALTTLSKIYNIDIQDIIAIGDAGNDIPMIKSAGLGIAMGNSADFVKLEAKAVAPRVEDDAIKYVIETYCK